MNPLAVSPCVGGRGGRSGCGSVDAGGEERLPEPAGIGHLCCLSVYPGGGRQPGGGDGIPGLLRRHPGAEELAVVGEAERCPASTYEHLEMEERGFEKTGAPKRSERTEFPDINQENDSGWTFAVLII